jgi:hypothetical protein
VPTTRRIAFIRMSMAVALTGGVIIGLSQSTATAADNVLHSNRAVPRACAAKLLPGGTAGVDQREVTSTVDGVVQARLRPQDGAEGDWDLAVFDKTSGNVVAASAALRSRELAESFVKKDQQLVIQGCRYDGPGRQVTLGVDFLNLTPQGPPALGVAATSAERAELVKVEAPTRADRDRLMALGLDVTEKADATSIDVVLAGDADRATLNRTGMKYSVVDGDLAASSRANAETDRRFAAATPTSVLPSGRTSYRHLYDYNFELKELARHNPGLVKAFTMPNSSIEGRDVVGIEIATNVENIADGKAIDFVMGVHHAREWPAGEHAMEWAYELVNGFRGNNAEIRSLVGKTRNIIVPIVNVDGFSISREATPLGNFSRFDYEMKRKTCRVEDSPENLRTGICMANPGGRVRGTDPNRNYAGFWGGRGASTVWSSDTFRGAAPFSEPETQNIRSIVATRQVTNLITLHTFSNLVLRVPGLGDRPRPLDEPAYKALGDKMASRNGYTSEAGWQLYDTTGTTEDWSYWATGGWAFTFEIGGSEFHPAFQNGVVAEYAGLAPAAGAGHGGNRQAFIDMLANTADPSAHATLIGSAPRGFQLQLRKTFQTPTSPVIQPDGSVGAPLFYTDTLTSDLESTGGRFAWSINPSTRPYVAGQFGRDPKGPAQAAITGLANPPSVPPINTNYPGNPSAEMVKFHVDGMPAVDNGLMMVSVDWGTPNTDWDMYILGPDGKQVASSASGGTTSEHAGLFDPPPGDYTAVLVNFAQADPANVDDWKNMRVEFSSPTPAVYGPKEAYTLTCSDRRGRLVGLADVFADRGQTVDVGEVCTRSARETKAQTTVR